MNLVDRMPFVPRNLSYLVSKVSGYSRQKIRLIQQNRTEVNGGGSITLSFPEGAIIDFSTFAMYCTPKTVSPSGKHATINDIEDVINKVNIKVGGVTITNVDQHYNRLFKLHRLYQMGDKESIRSVVSSIFKGATGDVSSNDLTNNPVEKAIHTFMGFLGSVSPSCLDTSLFQGALSIEFVLAGSEILVTSDGTANGSGFSYSLDNVYAEVDTIKMPSIYREAIMARMSNDNPIEIPFQQWASFSANGVALNATPTVPWNYSSECINAIYATVYDTTDNFNSTVPDATTKHSKHWSFGSSTLQTVHQKINGLSYPSQGEQNMTQSFVNTYHNLVGNQDVLGSSYAELKSLADYKSHYFVNVVRLSHDNDPAMLSGYSSAGGNLQGIVQFKGTASTKTCMPYVYIQSTARLLVRPGVPGGAGIVEVRY